MSAEIKKLMNKRKSLFRKIETLHKLADKANKDGVESSNFKKFISGYESLPDTVSNFETVHLEIVSLVETDEVDNQVVEQEAFDDLFYSIKTIFRDLMGECDKKNKVETQSMEGNASVSGEKLDRVKLPQLEIPKFDGDLKKWPTFIDMFKTLIHENQVLSNIERFQYLISYLEKDAASVVKNIPITEDNYATAYASLTKRYQNKRVLISNYWYSIYRAEYMKTSSPGELRKLISIFSENLSALTQFDDVDLWDFTKFNLLIQKIDSSLKTLFEIEYSNKDIPKYDDLCKFLERQCKAMENSQLFSRTIKSAPSRGSDRGKCNESRQVSSYLTKNEIGPQRCNFCKQGIHSLSKCDKFLSANVDKRHSFIKNNRLCFNCLSLGHGVDKCESIHNCRVCDKRHHSLLHFQDKIQGAKDNSADLQEAHTSTQVYTSTLYSQKSVLFATAIVSVHNDKHQPVTCRVLLDTGSQANFVSENCVRKLGLKREESSTPIQGLDKMTMCASFGKVNIQFTPSKQQSPLYSVSCIILPNICESTPATRVPVFKWKYLKNLQLADPKYYEPAEIDVLLGVDTFSQILLSGIQKGQNGGPCALKTTLGWVLMGSLDAVPLSNTQFSYFTSVTGEGDSVDFDLRRFWEIENVPKVEEIVSADDKSCEDQFVQSIERVEDGRYCVQLPFQNFPPSLGNSKEQAVRRFFALESRLRRDTVTRQLYEEFMKDYLDQHHMQLVDSVMETSDGYFIPHHGVMKGKDEQAKIRVVFDASCKSSNGMSLNDTLFAGPKLQLDILAILLNFRTFHIVFTTDIRQMYRQILVNRKHTKYQKIIWRFSETDPLREYELLTVTYGVSSSPYLAIRTLLQLIRDHGDDYPLASKILKELRFMDDILGGAFTLKEALNLQQQLIALLDCGKFELRKWASNSKELLEGVPTSHQQPISFCDSECSSIKVLGLQWCPVSDSFGYHVVPSDRDCTKRSILSEIARIYDPVGFICPVILSAKILIQRLWVQGVAWDDIPSKDIVERWQQYRDQLPQLSALSIPRQVIVDEGASVQLHGFSDASEVGYGAVVYFRQELSNGEVCVSLVCARSKVSPLKRVSLPRLELSAALLLAELIEFVVTNLFVLKVNEIFAWSDSTVALTWIRSSPHRWKTFVANRVSQIQEKVPPERWFFVDGKSNPADCASRGLLPTQLISHELWWKGPSWLKCAANQWPVFSSELSSEMVAGEEKQIVCLAVQSTNGLIQLLEKRSSMRSIQGIVAFSLRFIRNCRCSHDERVSGTLSYNELYSAMVSIVRVVQEEVFATEFSQIRRGLPCAKPIRQLAPFIDRSGIIRVGGRLRHSDISYDAKHPILLPRNHRLSELIILQFHQDNLHPGPRTLQYLLTQQFWILSARRAIRHVLSRCFKCFRANPRALTPFMGDLPGVRVNQVKAFSNSGVDFAGPVSITLGKYRGVKSQKAYICVFVCLATKALHLEVVSDLSSDAFLAALRRFVARRGRCSNLYSDQGTNFVGALKLLKGYAERSCESLSIRWHFNPPASPHFGGIWEAAVKSVKTHLLRVIGDQILTFEEMSTLLAQIESVLNSRPLCSISPDPNDFNSLTPGHFLTTEPLTAPPDDDLTQVKVSRLSRWQLVQQLHQHFWQRWRTEYLHSLQQRLKWNTVERRPSEGDLVIIKDNNTPPLRWPLARITKIYPSPDGIARVAQVRTPKGLFDRPLVKLCPLPAQ